MTVLTCLVDAFQNQNQIFSLLPSVLLNPKQTPALLNLRPLHCQPCEFWMFPGRTQIPTASKGSSDCENSGVNFIFVLKHITPYGNLSTLYSDFGSPYRNVFFQFLLSTLVFLSSDLSLTRWNFLGSCDMSEHIHVVIYGEVTIRVLKFRPVSNDVTGTGWCENAHGNETMRKNMPKKLDSEQKY